MEAALLDHRKLYRLPWSLPDNAISWLEPTSACNLACDGCYRENINDSHKPIEVIKKELDVFERLRNSDGVSIAGGDPLLHPDIIEIVKDISSRGIKPIINTNGLALTKEFLKELKTAGVIGFTFHIDSKQGRPGWKNKTELELNELRLKYAEMLAEAGGITCSFNSTVYEDTLHEVPSVVDWAAKHIDIVHVVVFIAYRQAIPDIPMDWYAGAQKIDLHSLLYSSDKKRKVDILSTDILEEIKKKIPDFTPCGYLNGTEKPDSFKWLLSVRLGTKEKIYGYLGPRSLEIIQTQNHLWSGKYLAYASTKITKMGKSVVLLSPFDFGARKIASNYISSLLTNPLRLFKRMHFQSVMLIQPVDFMEDGGQNMCDGCPDITVWEDKLVWSCRLEEPKNFGCFVRTIPRRI